MEAIWNVNNKQLTWMKDAMHSEAPKFTRKGEYTISKLANNRDSIPHPVALKVRYTTG